MANQTAEAPSRREIPIVTLFVLAILGSAFLIFLVQPMVGKRILPWFGGTPAVWMVCLAFYQTALFLGYAYAHLLIRFATPARQLTIHLLLVGGALLLLPVLPEDSWRPNGIDQPVEDILIMLVANVAVPFLVLASTGPLVQAWFSRLFPTRSPYPLYAVSNGGSLLALFAFPFFLEPSLGLSEIAHVWSLTFFVTVALILVCGFLTWRRSADLDEIRENESTEAVNGFQVFLWLSLSATGVMLLMGITNQLCLNVSNVPFLWILPLALYLLTMILCFGSERTYRRPLFLVLGFALLIKTIGLPLWSSLFVNAPLFWTLQASLIAEIVSYGLLLFSMAMLMHGELYRLRPPAQGLTGFYLCVAGGGALGGLFVGLAAPFIFDDYHELPLGLALAWLLIPTTTLYDRKFRSDLTTMRWPGALLSTAAITLIATVSFWTLPSIDGADVHAYQARTFFGVLRVSEFHYPRAHRVLTHGSTLHGVQFMSTRSSRIPTAYYGRATPIGLLLASREIDRDTRVGVVGLGAGTLAAYGRDGDLFRFYEIDESVIHLASKEGPFKFLEMSAATIETVVGDARLALEDERAVEIRQDFDLLVVDAFSSDGIPVHLLTREAFQGYAAALAPDGLIAIHVSTKHLKLMPQVARQGADAGFSVLALSSSKVPRYESQPTEWVFLSPTGTDLKPIADRMFAAHSALSLPAETLVLANPEDSEVNQLRVWTDEQSDVFSLIKSLR